MNTPSERDLKALALLLASHTDDLQMYATSLAKKMSDAYLSFSDGLKAVLVENYARFAESDKNGTYEYISGISKLKKAILEIRRERFEPMMELLRDGLEALERNEEKFSLAWISALYEAFGMDPPKTSDLSKRKAEDVRKYGVYKGETVETIFRKILEADVTRLADAVFIEAGMRSMGNAENLRTALDKAMLTTVRQINVNVLLAVNGVSNDVAVAVTRRNSRYVDALLWETELDERVCEDCDELEGKVFSPDDVPSCPMHPNCRCRLIPIQRDMAEYLVEELED